ncbi:hypothetical protein C0J52_18053 [Blattella germanica]|nr:hypothetical protein C0J52_18053 [Blattella germanica]
MVTSAVLGAAAGTGLALVVAMTIVVYRYYALRRRGKDWSYLERFGDSGLLGADWSGYKKTKASLPVYTVTQKEFNVAKEQHVVQPAPTVAPHTVNPEIMRSPMDSSPVLTHQSKSYPGGQPRFARTPSGHRGSSPQIRTFAPDGRTTSSAALQHLHGAQSSDPGSGNATFGGNSRSPSPASCHRAASLDMRCSSPGSTSDLHTPSPSQSSLVSLTDRGSASSACNSPVPPASPRGSSISRQPPEEMQELLLSLSYLPSAERLTVVLLKARNLFLHQEKDNMDKRSCERLCSKFLIGKGPTKSFHHVSIDCILTYYPAGAETSCINYLYKYMERLVYHIVEFD